MGQSAETVLSLWGGENTELGYQAVRSSVAQLCNRQYRRAKFEDLTESHQDGKLHDSPVSTQTSKPVDENYFILGQRLMCVHLCQLSQTLVYTFPGY